MNALALIVKTIKNYLLLSILYLSVFRLQITAVTAKNVSFDEDLTIAVVKQVLSIIGKRLFVMLPNSNRAHFMAVTYRNTLLVRDIKFAWLFQRALRKTPPKLALIFT